MKKIIIPFLFLIVMTTFGMGCFSRPEIPNLTPQGPQEIPAPILQAQHEEGTFRTDCGTNQGTIDYQTYTPSNWNGQLFAMLLNGSPGTVFLSQTLQTTIDLIGALPGNENYARALRAHPDPFRGLLAGLLSQGYKVLEIKYDRHPNHNMEGFYSLCYQKGLANVQQHNRDLYTEITARLGYDPTNTQHRLSGFGVSLGGIQLTHMAYVNGQKFEKVGIAGALAGDSQRGCREGRRNMRNGMGWSDFLHLALAIALPGQGCNEYDSTTNFDQFPDRNRGDLGLFEGERLDFTPVRTPLDQILSIPGLPLQAEYIRDTRRNIPSTINTLAAGSQTFRSPEGATTLHTYPGCGHVVLGCPQAPNIVSDILTYFDPSRRGLDHQLVPNSEFTDEEAETARLEQERQTARIADLRRRRMAEAAAARANTQRGTPTAESQDSAT